NAPSVPESAKRLVARALPRFDHGHTPVTYGQIALPAGISEIGSGEALADRVRGLIAVERGSKIALSLEHIADFVMRDGVVTLPTGISGIGREGGLYGKGGGVIGGEGGSKDGVM